MAGLESLRTPDEVAELRGLSINHVLGLTESETSSAAPGEAGPNGQNGGESTQGASDEVPDSDAQREAASS
jgi:hypothetical protein